MKHSVVTFGNVCLLLSVFYAVLVFATHEESSSLAEALKPQWSMEEKTRNTRSKRIQQFEKELKKPLLQLSEQLMQALSREDWISAQKLRIQIAEILKVSEEEIDILSSLDQSKDKKIALTTILKNSESSFEKKIALQSFLKIADSGDVGFLTTYISELDQQERMQIFSVLSVEAPEKVAAVILWSFIENPVNPLDLHLTLKSLGNIQTQEVVDKFFKLLKDPQFSHARATVEETLKQFPSSMIVEKLKEILQDPLGKRYYQFAAQTLAKYQDKQVVDGLEKILNNPQAGRVQHLAALQSLGNLGTVSEQVLLEYSKNLDLSEVTEREGDRILAALVESLTGIGTPEAFSVVQSMIEESVGKKDGKWVKLLESVDEDNISYFQPFLESQLTSDNQTLQAQALLTLQKNSAKDIDYRQFLANENPMMRNLALTGLAMSQNELPNETWSYLTNFSSPEEYLTALRIVKAFSTEEVVNRLLDSYQPNLPEEHQRSLLWFFRENNDKRGVVVASQILQTSNPTLVARASFYYFKLGIVESLPQLKEAFENLPLDTSDTQNRYWTAYNIIKLGDIEFNANIDGLQIHEDPETNERVIQDLKAAINTDFGF